MSTLEQNNPFQYLNPDNIDADMATKMFVDVFKDYYQVLNPGHTFIHGARGSGKSMMFRIMKPDCQKILRECTLEELPFYSIYVPIKDTSLNISELCILEKKHGGEILNEHLLCLYFGICIFETLSKEDFSDCQDINEEVFDLYKYILTLIEKSGYTESINKESKSDIKDYFVCLQELCSSLLSDFSTQYLGRLVFHPNGLPYSGPLCLYSNFLLPIIKKLRGQSYTPNAPLYFLIDDADELNELQTKILNTWVSYRTTHDVCYKISTQLRYSTYFTIKGSKIDAPHDYFEITLNQVYTSDSKDRYISNVREIVEKRLRLHNIEVSADQFFPPNKEQEAAIEQVTANLRDEKTKEFGDAKKAYDFAYRNARPDYMTKMLVNEYTYSYAGFDQLAHLSSGIIRHFLDLATKMYSTTSKRNATVTFIPVGIQDSEIRSYSQDFFISEFNKVLSDKAIVKNEEELNNHKRLRNFIEALGKSFRIILKSNSSERRKFSFYFDEQLSDEAMKVLRLGEKYGFFHSSTLGSKSGLGRSRLFVLNRMLAPYYDLDPFSFSGYLYLTPKMIQYGMDMPNEFVRKISSKEYEEDKKQNEMQQLVIDFFNSENEWS